MGARVQADGSGDSRRDGGLCAESSGCAESPAGVESLSAWNNLPALKKSPVRARLPALWHSFGGVSHLDDYY